MTSGGDFLSGFSVGNTQKPLTGQNEKPVKDENPIEPEKNKKVSEAEKPATNVAENKKLADKIVEEAEKAEKAKNNTSAKPSPQAVATRPAQSASSVIKAPEHVVTTDKSYNKRTIIKYGVIGAVVVVVALIAFLIIRMIGTTEVPNFVGQELRQAELWQIQGGATVVASQEYSIEFNDGIIISQDVEPGETISSNSVLNVAVSQGPNMNELIDLPDFMTMTRGQITTWMNDLRMRSVQFTNEASAEVDQNHVIRVEFPPAVDPDNFRRSDSVTIFVSTGAATVQLPDFVGDDLEDVEEFINENPGIELVIQKEEHEVSEPGTVLRQNPARGTRIADGDTLTVVISQGEPIIVPNWGNIRRGEAEIPVDGLDFRVEDRFHATVPLGRFISQSVAAGRELFPGHDEEVRVVYSLGRPWIPSRVGELENVIDPMIHEFSEQGAPITREIRQVDHWEPRGTIVAQSVYHQFVALNANIVFSISRGNLQPPPEPLEPPPPLEDVWSIECDQGNEINGVITFPLVVMRNWQQVHSSVSGATLTTNRPSWMEWEGASLNFTSLSVNRDAVNNASITINVLIGGRSVASGICHFPLIQAD